LNNEEEVQEKLSNINFEIRKLKNDIREQMEIKKENDKVI
jgi:hypothetical protein